MNIELVGLQVENLRGFRAAVLSLERPMTLLVGPNNSGKTSLLRLLDWALNSADDELVAGQRDLTDDECSLLIPARATRGGARRLVLLVRIPDKRRHGRFYAKDGIARIRFRVRNDRIYLNIRTPTKSEPLGYESDAVTLLHELRSRTHFKLIPAARDAASPRFGQTLARALELKLRERAVHQTQGGAPGEYRQVNAALGSIKTVADGLVQPLWEEMRQGVLGLAREGTLALEAEAGDLVEWMASRVRFRLVTGTHDVKTISPVEVGSGLQSLLDLAVLRGEEAVEDTDVIVGIEEPEAFLHPSAQRTLARVLGATETVKRVVSTHSSVLVDEAEYGEVVLVRDHRLFNPRDAADERRRQINTALMTGQGSEAMFSRSVLLVEGDGDKLFFEGLRRRVARNDESRLCDELSIVRAGANTSFGQWIRLIESYLDPATGERPVDWLLVADGIDSTTEVIRAFRDSGFSLPADVDAAANLLRQAIAAGDTAGGLEATRTFNRLAEEHGLRMNLVPLDLEWCALQNASKRTVASLASLLGIQADDRATLLRKLGSKYGGPPPSDSHKEPWMRALVARELPWSEVSRDARDVLRRWLLGAGIDGQRATELLRRA